jgi:hypothetical protein
VSWRRGVQRSIVAIMTATNFQHGRPSDARRRFVVGFVLAPLVQTAVCLPAYGERIYTAVLLMRVAPNWSMDRLGDVLGYLALLTAIAYGLAVMAGLPILWGLRRLGYLSAPAVMAIGMGAGLLIFAFGAMATNDSQGLGLSALIGGAVAAGPLAFSVLSGLPWRIGRAPNEPSEISAFD